MTNEIIGGLTTYVTIQYTTDNGRQVEAVECWRTEPPDDLVEQYAQRGIVVLNIRKM